MGKITPQFHGKKGRSGRKSNFIELQKVETIKKAWDLADEVISADKKGIENIPYAARDMAKAIVVKSIPEQVEHSGEVAHTISVVNFSDVRPAANS